MTLDIPTPPHAYVPGQTPRHDEDHFDALKQGLLPGMSACALGGTTAWRAGLQYLDTGYFWECHEVLEAVWMVTPEGSAVRAQVQAVIQLANARLKLVMGKPRATLRLCAIVEGHLSACGDPLPIPGITHAAIAAQCRDACNAASSKI